MWMSVAKSHRWAPSASTGRQREKSSPQSKLPSPSMSWLVVAQASTFPTPAVHDEDWAIACETNGEKKLRTIANRDGPSAAPKGPGAALLVTAETLPS